MLKAESVIQIVHFLSNLKLSKLIQNPNVIKATQQCDILIKILIENNVICLLILRHNFNNYSLLIKNFHTILKKLI